MSIIIGLSGFFVLFIFWRHVSPSGILFYQGLAAAILSAILQLVIVLVITKNKTKNTPLILSNHLKDSLITFLVTYAFMFTIPTTVDRAYSVKMISRLCNEPTGLTSEELGKWFSTEFLKDDGVKRRLGEQLLTGSIYQYNGHYFLTTRGRILAFSFRIVQRIFVCTPAK